MDTIQRFMFDKENIRGEIVHLEQTYQTIVNQRPYPPMVRFLLGEALVSAMLLVNSIKFEGRLHLQFQGEGALQLLLVQVDSALHVRAMAKCEKDLDNEDYAKAFLNGQMSITLNPDNKTQSYQSIVPLLSTSMSENLANYFAQSEQIATKVWLACSDGHAAGMLLQLMPGESTTEREHFWEYALAMGETVREDELLRLDNETLLHRLYHETDVRVFEKRSCQFQCRCSTERMKQVLTTLGEEDIRALLAENTEVKVSCEFCNQEYVFDAVDVAALFHQPK